MANQQRHVQATIRKRGGMRTSRDYNAEIPTLLLAALLGAQPSPAHLRLFAPPARAALFSFAVTAERIEAVAGHYRQRFPATDAGSWEISRMNGAEAFDGAALFDRARLGRLYGGRAPQVARGPATLNGRVFSVVLILSPYPEADLSRLNPGTLIMTVRTRLAVP